ncbi:MAG: glycoside hydrolase family 97 N-terminal domain-containing protein [Spirosomataceae bacterium]
MIPYIRLCGVLFVLFVLPNTWAQQVATSVIESPDKQVVMNFYQRNSPEGKTQLFYKVSYQGKEVVLESKLDLDLDNHLSELAMALKVDKQKKWFDNLIFLSKKVSSKDTTWKPLYGENASVRDHYNEGVFSFQKEDNPDYKIDLVFRVYNEGVGIRYYFPENPKGSYYQICAENTEFTMPEGATAYYARWAQAKYEALPLKNWIDEAERPLTLKLPNGLFVSLAESAMVDYARTKFKLSADKANTILTSMDDKVDAISYFGTPWRTIIIGETAGQLIERNFLLLNLNEPNKIKKTDWIKPGKIMREMTLTTEGAFEAIDFAAKHHLQYILFDWKWYGPALTWDSDATQVKAKMDMPAIVKYGKKKGIGIWLYVNKQALVKQGEELFPLYKKWGIKGIKFGFVQVGSHRWTTWIEDMIKKCAANNLMVNIHDDWRPTGEMRTYPNLMTAEGIRGNEEFPDATHNTTLPFTRGICGAGDYTVCYYSEKLKNTHAHQLALSVVMYSPIQTLFWYDKPAAYKGEPEIEFFEKIPTTWDETKIVQGKIGEYIITARRSGKDWFIGILNNNDGRTLALDFNFLPKETTYTATIYADDDKVQTATKVGIIKKAVNHDSILPIQLKARGGQAIWLHQE